MTNILSPISIIEFSSTSISLAIYDEKSISSNLFYTEKINFKRNEESSRDKIISKLVKNGENELGKHLNEIILLIDSSNINSLDFSIQKNFDKNLITNQDINYLINECENEVKINNKEQEILHIITHSLLCDDKPIDDLDNISLEGSKVIVELKFILISKNICDQLKNLFLKKHIKLKSILCTSYIRSLGLISKLDISGYNSFIDIGLKKSCLTIFENNKLLFINNTHISGDHITKDISKLLKIDYRIAESKKIKFYKNNLLGNDLSENELLKKIINSRLEEIIEILFLNCPLVANNFKNSKLRLFFTGNGSKVLNENLLSFGPEFSFINEMSILKDTKRDVFDSAYKFDINSKNQKLQKQFINLENKGFFEKLFEYFN